MSVARASGWTFATNTSAAATMRRMANSVRDCLARSRFVVQTANDVVANVAPRDVYGQIQAITHWLDAHFRYLSDPVGVELLRDPNGCLVEIQQKGFTQGDCDEAAMLAATLGMANGIPARFRALGFYTRNAPYSHVIGDLLGPGGRWIPIDITKPAEMDVPPVATRTLIQAV